MFFFCSQYNWIACRGIYTEFYLDIDKCNYSIVSSNIELELCRSCEKLSFKPVVRCRDFFIIFICFANLLMIKYANDLETDCYSRYSREFMLANVGFLQSLLGNQCIMIAILAGFSILLALPQLASRDSRALIQSSTFLIGFTFLPLTYSSVSR